jgi:hypothetical protein
MSQFGMQMPGGQLQRGPSLNIYTGLLALAVLALLIACVFVAFQGQQIGPDGSPFATHKYNAATKNYDIRLSKDN